MNKKLFLLIAILAFSALAEDPKPSRIFKERVRTQGSTTVVPDDSDIQHEESHITTAEKNSEVLGSMDTLKSLARVQRDQAETFRMWASQFQTFKNNVMKFMDQTSDVLQRNEKKITTLQRVVRKIASDMDE